MKKDTPTISKALIDLASVDDVVLFTTSKGQAALTGGKLETAQRNLLDRIDGFRSMEQVLAMSGDMTSVHGVLGKLMAAGYVNSIAPMEDDEPEEEQTPVEAAPVAVAPPPKPAPKAPAATPAKAVPAPAAKAAAAAPAKVPAAPAAKASAPPPAAKSPAPAPPATKAAPPVAKAPAPAAPAAKPQKPPASAVADEPELSELDNAKELLNLQARHFLGASAEKLRERIDDVRSIEEIYDLIVKIRAHVSRKTGEADSDKFLEQLINGLAARKKKPGKK